MKLTSLLLLLIGANLIVSNNSSSFNLILNVDGIENHFRFVETTTTSAEERQPPSVIILDNNHDPTIINPLPLSSIQTYHAESDENLLNIATVIYRTPPNSNLLFATLQTSNDSFYDVSSSMAIINPRTKRSLNDDYIVRFKNSVIEQAYVTIEWHNSRKRREVEITTITSNTEEGRFSTSEELISSTFPSVSLPDTLENITVLSGDNNTEMIMNSTIETITPRRIPEKSRHLNLEITAVIDSLILNDVRTLLNKNELETMEILKLYYMNIFMDVEQIYRQSLIHETLDVHIRLSKIIFATDKHRLPWELFTNISSIINPYRKSPNDMHRRPNISMTLLKSLHQAYTSNQFDIRFFKNDSDHIMTFTRLDLIDGAGSAYVLGACLPSYKYSIVQEDLNSFSVILTVAHELGHNLGLNHDELENKCNDPSVRYIMSPKNMNTVDRRQLPYFSECSIKQLNDFADNTTTTCWKNAIISTRNDTKLEEIRNIISTKFGQIINLHHQCQLQFGSQAVPFISVIYNQSQTLYEENVCDQLRCFKALGDEYMYWQDGAFDGTSCGENRICYQKQCISTNETIEQKGLVDCPYGDLYVPIALMNLMDISKRGNMLCPDALNLLRSRGMNVTYLCSDPTLRYQRLCCEECKKHSIPECGDLHSRCPMFAQYCKMQGMIINGVPITELCPYTCSQCPQLPPPIITTTMITITKNVSSTKAPVTKKIKLTTPKARKYVKPKTFDTYTCIDSADCPKLIKTYSKLKKNVKNWCTEYSTMVKGRYFAEMCPKYCSLCNITSECDQYKLCHNNGTCIKDEHGTYQCLCSSSKSYYGTLCEYRQTCLDNPCSSKNEYCIQTRGENYLCLSKEDKEQMRVILDGKKII